MSNSLGAVVFFSIDMPATAAAQQVELESRSGVDGLAIWLTGSRGEPFDITTTIDLVGTLATAQTVMNTYRAMKAGGPYTLTRASTALGSVVVIDVKPISDELVVTAVGGVNGGNVLLTARWTLVAVA